LFSRPIPSDQVPPFLLRHHARGPGRHVLRGAGAQPQVEIRKVG
jgi:hypothetical protein